MGNVSGLCFAVATVLCWSSYNVAAKHGLDMGFSPEALVLLRFSVPGLIALPVLLILYFQAKRLRVSCLKIAALAVLGGPIFGLAAVGGYEHAPLSHGLLFAPVAVFLTGSVLGKFLLHEAITCRQLIGACIMFAGLFVLVGFETRDLSVMWHRGIALFMLAGCMWGGYTVLLRLWRVPLVEGTLAITMLSAFVAIIVLGPSAISTLSGLPLKSVLFQLMLQGLVGGVISVVALIAAVQTLPAQQASLLPVFTPAVALVIAGITLRESPSIVEIIGVVIIGGGFIVNLKNSANTHRKRWRVG